MKAFKYLVFLFFMSSYAHSAYYWKGGSAYTGGKDIWNSPEEFCAAAKVVRPSITGCTYTVIADTRIDVNVSQGWFYVSLFKVDIPDPEPEPEEKCKAGIVPVTLKVPVSSGKMVCVDSCQYSLTKCVDVDFEAGMTCDGVNEGRDCGTPPPTTTPTTPPVTQDPTNPTDKTDEQKTFENIMHVIGEKLDGIKDAITGGNQNQNGGDTGGSNGGTTGGDVNVNVDMSETNAKIDETNSLIDELTKWLQGEDLGDDIFGDSEPPEKELTPQQLETNIFSGRAQCPADSRLSFNLLGGKTFTKTFEFKDWCDNLEIFGSFILIASYLFGAYIIVSKS